MRGGNCDDFSHLLIFSFYRNNWDRDCLYCTDFCVESVDICSVVLVFFSNGFEDGAGFSDVDGQSSLDETELSDLGFLTVKFLGRVFSIVVSGQNSMLLGVVS